MPNIKTRTCAASLFWSRLFSSFFLNLHVYDKKEQNLRINFVVYFDTFEFDTRPELLTYDQLTILYMDQEFQTSGPNSKEKWTLVKADHR